MLFPPWVTVGLVHGWSWSLALHLEFSELALHVSVYKVALHIRFGTFITYLFIANYLID